MVYCSTEKAVQPLYAHSRPITKCIHINHIVMERPPIKYIVQIDNMYLADLMFYWTYYNQPCTLVLLKPKTEGLSAVKLIVDSDEAASFLFRVQEKTGCRLHIKD